MQSTAWSPCGQLLEWVGRVFSQYVEFRLWLFIGRERLASVRVKRRVRASFFCDLHLSSQGCLPFVSYECFLRQLCHSAGTNSPCHLPLICHWPIRLINLQACWRRGAGKGLPLLFCSISSVL